jgi:Glycosyltransferase family 87
VSAYAATLRRRAVPGRGIVLFSLYGYFVALIAQGGHLGWEWFQVPATTPSFLDLRSVTSGWECTRKGIDVLARNPCDPFPRPANYPRMWLWPSFLGLGQSSTLILGIVIAIAFFAGALALMGRVERFPDALVWVALLVSPAVMLGVERGNPDLIVFPIVVAGLLMLRARGAVARAVGHAALLLAAMLKLFPVFAFIALLRQPRRRAIVGGGLVVVGFGIYAVATLGDIETIHRVLPQEIYYSYGADVAVRAVTLWLSVHYASLASLGGHGPEQVVLWSAVALAVVAAIAIARLWRAPEETTAKELDLFLAGSAIFVGSFILEHNFDYRLVYLLLAVPQLLGWMRKSKLAAVVLFGVVCTLWVSEVLSNGYWTEHYPLPYDEVLTWFLFVTLLGMSLSIAARRVYPLLRFGGFGIASPYTSQ